MIVVSAISDFVRGLIRRLVRPLNKITGGKLTPLMVTATGTAMHIPIALLIAYDQLLWAAVLLVVFGLFDALDGELARLQGVANSKGMIYDASTDRIKETLIYSGIAYLLATNGQAEWVFVPVLACGISITVSYAKAKGEAALALEGKFSDHHKLNRHFKEGLVPFELRMAIILVGLLLDQVLLATGLVAVLAMLTVFERLRSIAREL